MWGRSQRASYAATIHAVQGDTANSGHLVLGEHTGAAAAYVGMTRGRTNNTAHLVADTLDQAREQWITAFSHDRADLGPAHAADLAAAEAERYAPHRPLQEALAELHHTWTLEQDCLDQLVSDRHRRDQLRHIIAVTAERDAVMPPLEAAHHAARLRADQAAERFAQVAAAVDAHACHIADHLHRTWDSQRPAARAAAHTVRAGPGRLGQHSRAVRHASDQLQQWADTWRPILPDLPSSLDGIVAVAAGFDDTQVHDAFRRHGRRIADHAHPHYRGARDTARATAAAAAQTWTAYESAASRYEQQLWRYGLLAGTPHPQQTLDRLTHRITDTQRRLDHARGDLATLTRTRATDPPRRPTHRRTRHLAGHPHRPAKGRDHPCRPNPSIHCPGGAGSRPAPTATEPGTRNRPVTDRRRITIRPQQAPALSQSTGSRRMYR